MAASESTDSDEDIQTEEEMDIAQADEQPVDSGSAMAFRTSNGQIVAVPQHIHYAYRGPELATLTLYEYVALVKIVRRRGQEYEGIEQHDDGQPLRRGREPNAVFQFDPEHPLSRTHQQQLRSKIVVPQPVALPPNVLTVARDRVALYYLSLLRPWNVNSLPHLEFSWRATDPEVQI